MTSKTSRDVLTEAPAQLQRPITVTLDALSAFRQAEHEYFAASRDRTSTVEQRRAYEVLSSELGNKRSSWVRTQLEDPTRLSWLDDAPVNFK